MNSHILIQNIIIVINSKQIFTSAGALKRALRVEAIWGNKLARGPADAPRGPRTSSSNACRRWLESRPRGRASRAHTVYSLQHVLNE